MFRKEANLTPAAAAESSSSTTTGACVAAAARLIVVGSHPSPPSCFPFFFSVEMKPEPSQKQRQKFRTCVFPAQPLSEFGKGVRHVRDALFGTLAFNMSLVDTTPDGYISNHFTPSATASSIEEEGLAALIQSCLGAMSLARGLHTFYEKDFWERKVFRPLCDALFGQAWEVITMTLPPSQLLWSAEESTCKMVACRSQGVQVALAVMQCEDPMTSSSACARQALASAHRVSCQLADLLPVRMC